MSDGWEKERRITLQMCVRGTKIVERPHVLYVAEDAHRDVASGVLVAVYARGF